MKFLRKHLAWIGIATVAACFAWRAYLVTTGVFWMRISGAFDTKVDAMMIGCLGAIALHNPKIRGFLQKYCTHPLVPIALLAFVMYYLRGIGHPFGAVSVKDKILYWDVRLPIFTVSFAALMMSLCLQPTSIVAKFFSLKPLVWIGKVSYSLYLWHMLAFVFVMNNLFNPGKSPRLDVEFLEYGLAIAFAAISYYLVESPFLKIKDRFSMMASGSSSRGTAGGIGGIGGSGEVGGMSSETANKHSNEYGTALAGVKKTPGMEEASAEPQTVA